MSSTALPIVRNASRVCSTTAAPSLRALGAVLDDRDGLGGLLLHRPDQLGDLLRGVLGILGELTDFLGDDREASALLTGARRLDRGVEREQVRLLGDPGDRLHDHADLL